MGNRLQLQDETHIILPVDFWEPHFLASDPRFPWNGGISFLKIQVNKTVSLSPQLEQNGPARKELEGYVALYQPKINLLVKLWEWGQSRFPRSGSVPDKCNGGNG